GWKAGWGKPVFVAGADDLFERVGARRRQTADQPGSVAFEPAHEPQRRPIAAGKVDLSLDAAGQDLFQLEAPLDDLIAPILGGLLEPRIFELEEMFDDVLAK